jgi:hypothetical protein
MVRQNPASKRVIAKIVFLKDLGLKVEPGAGLSFFLDSIYLV